MTYEDHSKFIFANFDKIQQSINEGVIDANDIVISQDTNEIIIIRDDLSLMPIKSKIYRFPDTSSAENELNKKSDTYEGQLVSVLSERGTYEAYIVNKNERDYFYVTPLNAFTGNVDYDSLQHKPIINLNGDVGEPVIVSGQKDGIYKINGNYKISNEIKTVFSSVSNNLFIVSHKDDGSVTIKKIGDEIVDYIINQSGDITTSIVPTTEWLKEQGYATESYVDAKLDALDFITRDEIESYVRDLILQTIDTTLDQRIDAKFDEKFEAVSEKEIVDMFSQK